MLRGFRNAQKCRGLGGIGHIIRYGVFKNIKPLIQYIKGKFLHAYSWRTAVAWRRNLES